MDQKPTIEKFRQESEAYKEALQTEISGWIERSKSIVLRFLIVGGSLTLAYIILKQFLGESKADDKKSKSSNVKPTLLSELRHFVLRELSVFLLTNAKQRLLNYLKESNTDEGINSENS